MGGSAGRQTLAVVATKYEGDFLFSRNDGNAFLEDLGGFLNTPEVIITVRCHNGHDPGSGTKPRRPTDSCK